MKKINSKASSWKANVQLQDSCQKAGEKPQ